MTKKLSIVIPCYNEEQNISQLIQSLSTIEKKYIEFILVNNGSTDNTANVLNDELNNKNKDLYKIVTVEKNQGYGFGILSGLKECRGEILSWTHADLQTDVKDIIKALDKYEEISDTNVIIKGKRCKRKIMESLLTFGMQLVALFFLKSYLTDINAQPKLFSKNFYLSYIKDKAPYDFSLDLYVLYIAKQHGKIKEVPVYFKKRLYGEAKGGSGSSLSAKFKIIKRTIKYMKELSDDLKNIQN